MGIIVAAFQSSGKREDVKQWLIMCVSEPKMNGRTILIDLIDIPSDPVAFDFTARTHLETSSSFTGANRNLGKLLPDASINPSRRELSTWQGLQLETKTLLRVLGSTSHCMAFLLQTRNFFGLFHMALDGREVCRLD